MYAQDVQRPKWITIEGCILDDTIDPEYLALIIGDVCVRKVKEHEFRAHAVSPLCKIFFLVHWVSILGAYSCRIMNLIIKSSPYNSQSLMLWTGGSSPWLK